MGFREEYGELNQASAEEEDAIAMRYFRADELRVDRKGDGSAVTQADRGVAEMARAKMAASGQGRDVLGQEMGGGGSRPPHKTGPGPLIHDPVDAPQEIFLRGPT